MRSITSEWNRRGELHRRELIKHFGVGAAMAVAGVSPAALGRARYHAGSCRTIDAAEPYRRLDLFVLAIPRGCAAGHDVGMHRQGRRTGF